MNDTKSGGGLILQAMEAVADGTKYPEFKGNVATVYTHPLEHTPVRFPTLPLCFATPAATTRL